MWYGGFLLSVFFYSLSQLTLSSFASFEIGERAYTTLNLYNILAFCKSVYILNTDETSCSSIKIHVHGVFISGADDAEKWAL